MVHLQARRSRSQYYASGFDNQPCRVDAVRLGTRFPVIIYEEHHVGRRFRRTAFWMIPAEELPSFAMDDSQPEVDLSLETPTSGVFIPPSIHHQALLNGASYTHFSAVPPSLLPQKTDTTGQINGLDRVSGPPCVLGIDEAGRGPVLGPMVYGAFYLPLALSSPLLSETHHFDDSKILAPSFRSQLMETLCTPPAADTNRPTAPDPRCLYSNCGWAVEVMSARDISANMMKPFGTYNLNAQAMDATISLIQRIFDKGVNIMEIYIDTIGQPAVYQKKLERIFPTAQITVAKKADSLYPCVSAASVCAKVTRDAALEVLYTMYSNEAGDAASPDTPDQSRQTPEDQVSDWGSGYPSDVRCTSWMKRNMDPVFGWGSECRFSWGTAKDLLEVKGAGAPVTWPLAEDDENSKLTNYFSTLQEGHMAHEGKTRDGLVSWYGTRAVSEF
jgi:ribonuclease H2 subunit A